MAKKSKRPFQPPVKTKRAGTTRVTSLCIPISMFERIEAETQRLGTDRSSYIRSAIEYVWANAPEYTEPTAAQ
jgi:hypothetical protein